jgi:hypothetical protein
MTPVYATGALAEQALRREELEREQKDTITPESVIADLRARIAKLEAQLVAANEEQRLEHDFLEAFITQPYPQKRNSLKTVAFAMSQASNVLKGRLDGVSDMCAAAAAVLDAAKRGQG